MEFHDPMMPIAHNSGSLPACADDLISELALKVLTPAQKERLVVLISERSPGEEFDIHKEIESQYVLIQSIRADLMDPNGGMRSNMEPREIQTIIGLFNSFMTLYLRSMERLDKDKELSQIESAVKKAMMEAPKDVQDKFIESLEKYLGG